MRSFQRKPVFTEVTNHIIPPKNDGIVFLKNFPNFCPILGKKIYCNKNCITYLSAGIRQTWKTWKTQGILFEANYFDFSQILSGVNLVFYIIILNYGKIYILLNYGRIYYY